MNTIYILWLRQIKRFVRSRSRLIGSLGQPVLFLVAFGFGFGPVFAKAGQGSYLQFLTPGIISQTILFSAVFFGIEIIWDRQFGFLKETLVAPLSRFEIMLGRTLGGATLSTLQGMIVFVISLIAGFKPLGIINIFYSLIIMFILAVLFTALGTAIASKLEDMHAFQMIMNFLIMPLFFLSGALFPAENLPVVFNGIIRINPMSYGVDALRGTLIGTSYFGVGNDIKILSITAFVILGIGSYLFKKIEL